MQKTILLVLVLGFTAVFSVTRAVAEMQPTGFFSGDVRDAWSPQLEITNVPNLAYFPTQPKKPDPKKLPILQKPGVPADPNKGQAEVIPEKYKDDPVAAKLVSEYGDPAKEAPVKAKEDAPKPFRGLMDALQAGRDDLAYSYARQYVTYMRKLQEQTSRAMAMQGLAMEQEGLLPPGGWQSDPRFAALVDRSLLEKSVAENEAQIKANSPEMAQKFREMISKASVSQDTEAFDPAGLNRGMGPGATDERSERAKARRMTASLPRDPKGKVDVYFFLRPNHGRSLEMAKQFEAFFKLRAHERPQNIAGMVLDSVDPILDNDIRSTTGATFPLVDGRQMAQSMRLSEVPLVVYVTQTTKQVHVEGGLSSSFYLDEVLRVMEGR